MGSAVRSGAGVRLERPALARVEAFLTAVARSRALHGRWVRAPSTPEQFEAFVARAETPTQLSYLVCTRAGDLAGVVNVTEIVRGAFRSAYLGYYALEPHARRGYMHAGVAAVIRQAFGMHRLHRLEANIQPGNARSIALVRGLGFEREGYSPNYLKIAGRWRDHERWALRSEIWRARPAAGC